MPLDQLEIHVHTYNDGGLGIHCFLNMSKAYAMKLWWSFVHSKSLWLTFMHANYCKNTHPNLAPISCLASHIWKRMVDVREILQANTP